MRSSLWRGLSPRRKTWKKGVRCFANWKSKSCLWKRPSSHKAEPIESSRRSHSLLEARCLDGNGRCSLRFQENSEGPSKRIRNYCVKPLILQAQNAQSNVLSQWWIDTGIASSGSQQCSFLLQDGINRTWSGFNVGRINWHCEWQVVRNWIISHFLRQDEVRSFQFERIWTASSFVSCVANCKSCEQRVKKKNAEITAICWECWQESIVKWTSLPTHETIMFQSELQSLIYQRKMRQIFDIW